VAGGALIIIAGAVAFGLTEAGGPAGATTLPSSCPAASSSSAASEASAAIARMNAVKPAATAATVTPLQGVATGIDISSHNAEPGWAAARQVGTTFVAIKATEGDYYTNNTATTTPVAQPGYGKEFTDATAAGDYVMPYAFANPYQGDGTSAHTGNGSGTCQADYAWQEIGPADTAVSPTYTSSSQSLPVVLDIEPDPYVSSEGANANACYGLNPSQLATWIGDFLTEMQADSGKTPIIYTDPTFWSACIGGLTSFTTTAGTTGSFSSYPLWLADYGVTAPPAVAGLASPTFWQFTNDATVTPIAGLDEDYLMPVQQTGKVGTAVTPVQLQSLNSLNGQPVTYSVTPGLLPPGLTLSSSGLITGTPTASGAYGAQVKVTPASTANGETPTFLNVGWEIPSDITVSMLNPSELTMGTPVSLQVTATDANPAGKLAFTASGLPAGLSINSATGLISGWPVTPTSVINNVKVTVTDGLGNTATDSFQWGAGIPGDTGVTGVIRQYGGSNKCVDDPSSKTANWTPIDLVTCNASKSNQVWTAVQDGTIRVLGHCLTASGTGVYLYSCNDTIAEQWRAGSFGSIVSARYGTCLNGPSGGVAEGTKLTTATCQNTASTVNQHWSRPVAPIVSGVAARCLNVATASGAVTFYTCGNYATEHWTLTPSGTLVAQSSGKCLTEHSADGSTLIQYTCVKGSVNQQFRIEAVNAIATEIQSTDSGLCVTVPSLSSPNASALVLGSCQATPLSTWRIG
jgi:GH25 family lysozyme M1 (1,4-beta-N-acetylmuramidase)